MDERLHAPAAYPIPRPDLPDRTVALAPNDLGRRGRAGRLARILWQGLRRQALTTVGAIQGVFPKLVQRLSADILLDADGRMVLGRRDLLGRIVGIQRGGEGQAGIGVPMPPGSMGLIQLGDLRAPERIYVGRTEREVLGLYQQDGRPDRTLLCGLGEGLQEDRIFARIVAKHPAAAVHLAIEVGDDEGMAQAFEARILAALRGVNVPEARVEVRRSAPLEPSPIGRHDVLADPLSPDESRTQRRGRRTGPYREVEGRVVFPGSLRGSHER